MPDEISIYDSKTSLCELRSFLGWNTTPDNTAALAMVLCDRLESLQQRVDQLQSQIEALQSPKSVEA